MKEKTLQERVNTDLTNKNLRKPVHNCIKRIKKENKGVYYIPMRVNEEQHYLCVNHEYYCPLKKGAICNFAEYNK